MAIYRKVKNSDNPYVMINRSAIQDDNLSWKAKGVLVYLLSLPDDWRIYESELCTHSPDGLTTLKTSIKELISAGYIVREQDRDETGKFNGYIYNIHEQPLINSFNEQNISQNNNTELGVSVNCNPINGKTINGKSHPTNNNITNKTNNNINIVNLQKNTTKTTTQTSLVNTTNNTVHKQVIDYLNLKANKKYKHTTPSTVKHINARLTSGYTLQDFYKVIDVKVQEWKGTSMDKYLRPETLFGSKFENYINQVPVKNYNRGVDMEEYNKLQSNNTSTQTTNDIDDILSKFSTT